MVFSYAGQFSNEFSEKVLRLRKSLRWDKDTHFPSRACQKDNWQNDSPDSSIALQNIASKLVPPHYLPVLQNVHVSPKWLTELAEVAEEHRPAERTQKDGIDTTRWNALLATDLVSGEGWAVEIKVTLICVFGNVNY
jgi:inositol-pentakisphosphate 2-kinase